MASKKHVEQVPENENKSERFVRLAKQRMTLVVARMRQISLLANKQNYEYTQDQVDAMTRAIKSELIGIEAAFASGKVGGSGFEF